MRLSRARSCPAGYSAGPSIEYEFARELLRAAGSPYIFNPAYGVPLHLATATSVKMMSALQPSTPTSAPGQGHKTFGLICGIADFKDKAICVKKPMLDDLLERGDSKIMSDKKILSECVPDVCYPDEPSKFRWIHIPANHMDWVEVRTHDNVLTLG